MKFRLLSDLHFEYYQNTDQIDAVSPILKLSELDKTGVDGIILAGDIDTLVYKLINSNYSTHSLHFVEKLVSGYKYKLYVLGNHEFYNAKFDIDVKFKPILKQLGIEILNNEYIEIEDKLIFGGTGWFRDQPSNILYQNEVNDFTAIENIQDCYVSHKDFVDKLLDLANLKRDVDLVISHHLPLDNLIHPLYRQSNANRFFSMGLDNLVSGYADTKLPTIKTWVYGHTHTSEDRIILNTRYVCNPLGTPHKYNPEFKSNLIVEI